MSAQGSLTRLATQCQGNMPSPYESEGSEEAEGASPEERETTDTKWNLILKFFVIFLYFVVNKFYNVLPDPRLPLRASS